MSIPVELAELPAAVRARNFGYLLTVDDRGRAHAVALVPVIDGAVLRFAAGGTTRRNAEQRPDVSVVFPPTDVDEFSLVVDGRAHLDHDAVVVECAWAVRHRPAP